MSNKTNNLKAYLRDLYEGIVSKKPDASRNPQNFRSEIEAIRTGGELYEVMDASELPEDAPDGSLALVEGEPIPEAYTVSSVDELPSNAVDGSMAIVESDPRITVRKWITVPNTSEDKDYDMLFSVESDVTTHGFTSLMYLVEGGELLYIDAVSGLNPEYSVYYDGEWVFPDAQIIKVYYCDEEAKNMLDSCTELIRNGTTLYTHENGQWVYKCEVV